ncbi:hypothetical protein D1007_29510 [Hordeum vulgare]|nr:hypothetical protein D1007_29510 [Hordeum vulgare]
MGSLHKGGVWWLLLLAAVLLATAAAGVEQDDGAAATAVPEVEVEVEEVGRPVDDQGNDSCDIKCQHHKVPARKKQCVDECHSREHHHPSRASCERKCSHWRDPARKEQCVQQCMRYGLNLDVGGGDDVIERPHAEEVEVDDQSNDSCDHKCQHHKVPARKKRCVDECHRREHHHPSRAACERKCSHWRDPTRKERCVQTCMRYGLNLDVGGGDGDGDGDGEQLRRWEAVAGAIIEVV